MCNSYKKPENIQTGAGEVADIFRLYGDEYIKRHPLPAHYLKVIHDITVCRTEYLGGHIYKCDFCGYEKKVYNSCRNRHCPKCQFTARIKWAVPEAGGLKTENLKYFPWDIFIMFLPCHTI